MKRFFLFLSFFLLIFPGGRMLSAQEAPQIPDNVTSLTPDEMISLAGIPLLELPAKYRGPNAPLLPSSIDNSTQPYFRPITSQTGYECGQSGGIAFNFCYEIDRLRNLPANVTDNQYPTHFTWDFLNNGNNYGGASAFDSWEIVRACGNMNITDYGGGLGTGGYLRWISGYPVWYNGMANRINYVRAIRADTPDGLLTLKYWLFDHLEGSSVGGVGTFYGNYFGTPSTVLPPGTPEAGKYVEPVWGSSPSHTFTCVGYNDSIRWDYNGDGQYTNNIDINDDGVVDMHDWEIGGLKLASGYAGTGWSNGGFCYFMYKDLADAITSGGIWNHTIYVLDIKQTCSPKLTMKVILKHTSRNKLKVNVGMATDLAATAPSIVMDYPVFNYQGADHYMQGGTTEADKTIEFGLDLTPLLSNLTSVQAAKWFLQVQENDPTGAATGEITGWSLMDYTTGSPVEQAYPTGNVAIANNTLTRLSMNRTLVFSKPDITTSSLPDANLYQPYSVQLAAANGTSPYLWDAKLDYPETTSSATFPTVTAQQLAVTNNDNGYAVKTLPFSMPFYKKTVSKIYVYTDGYILFDDQPYTYPYLIDKMLLFRQTSIISPFMADLCVYPSQGDGIWFQGDANSATIRWKISVYNMSGTSSLNFAVKLYPDGKIEYYYGTMNYPAGTAWTGGLSGGDNKNYQFSLLNSSPTITANTLDKFTACGFPVEMQLSDDGVFSGTPVTPCLNRPINFRATDNNNIATTKVLNFTTNGLMVSYSVVSGTDSIIEFGETANINLTLTNIGSQVVHNVNVTLTESDPYITLTDSIQSFGNINAGQAVTINNALAFAVSQNIPNNHLFPMVFHITSTEQNFTKEIDLTAFAPDIRIGTITINDGDNGRLDPGETTDMVVSFENHGGAKINNLVVSLTSADTNVVINSGTGTISLLKPDSVQTVAFNITSDPEAPFQHLYRMNAALTATNGYASSDSIYLLSGDIIEDFETGALNKFNWQFEGNAAWYIDPGEHYEGSYCSRSGWITDNMESSMYLNINVIQAGKIGFWKKVSCEHDGSGNLNYDWLAFYIDNTLMGKWDGTIDWSKESYDIPTGYHTLKWKYHKDYSVSTGSDCSWIDFITFPLFEGALPQITATPLSFSKTLGQNETAKDTLYVSNTGGAILQYSVIVFDTASNKKDMNPKSVAGSYISCNSSGFLPGQPFSWVFTVHNGSPDNEYIRHVKMEFPQGLTVTNATNYSGGSLGDLVFQGTTGNGAILNWHGESTGGRGVIKPGENAMTTITGTIAEPFMQDVFIVYSIRGDSLFAVPHDASGYVKLTNYGLASSWLTLSNYGGTLFHDETDTLELLYNSTGLDPGTYHCSLVAKDLYNNQVVIPVTLQVQGPIGTSPGSQLAPTGLNGCYPNPVRQNAVIGYSLGSRQHVVIDLFRMNGEKACTLFDGMQEQGAYKLSWNGTDDHGALLLPGVYSCRMTTPGYSGMIKLVLIR
jgi:hypothetical protein